MLLPALNKARALAKSASCASNLKQIGLGFGMYLNDYDYYPKMGAGGGNFPWWQQQIAPYLQIKTIPHAVYIVGFDSSKDYPVLKCPSDETPVYTGTAIAGKGGLSYGYNNQIGGYISIPPQTWGCKTTNMKDPSNTYMLLDAKASNITYTLYTRIALRHNNKRAVNMLFADLHVQSAQHPLTTDVGGPGIARLWTPAKD